MPKAWKGIHRKKKYNLSHKASCHSSLASPIETSDNSRQAGCGEIDTFTSGWPAPPPGQAVARLYQPPACVSAQLFSFDCWGGGDPVPNAFHALMY